MPDCVPAAGRVFANANRSAVRDRLSNNFGVMDANESLPFNYKRNCNRDLIWLIQTKESKGKKKKKVKPTPEILVELRNDICSLDR